MARSISEIKAQMITAKNAETSLSGLDSTSQTAIWNLWIYIQAVAINLFEQILDVFKSDVETQVSKAIPQTAAWLQQKAFEFQYSTTTPQELTYTADWTLEYPTINPDLQIITRCSVTTGNNKTVQIKVAKGTTPEKLDTSELDAAKSYFRLLGNAGVYYSVITADGDFIEIDADIYYNGLYQPTIQQNVIDSILNYLATIPFDGKVYVAGIEDAIQSVQGVVDVKLNNIYVRVASTSYSSKSTLYSLSNGINGLKYQPFSGYMVEESTTSHTFADTLNFFVV
jgi:hypothetical protein